MALWPYRDVVLWHPESPGTKVEARVRWPRYKHARIAKWREFRRHEKVMSRAGYCPCWGCAWDSVDQVQTWHVAHQPHEGPHIRMTRVWV